MKRKYLFLRENIVEIMIADDFISRCCGLLGTKSLSQDKGLLLCPCNSVHMVGMLYALDIVYLNKTDKIIKIVENLRPFQFSGCWGAAAVLELRAGTVQRAGWELGQQVKWQ